MSRPKIDVQNRRAGLSVLGPNGQPTGDIAWVGFDEVITLGRVCELAGQVDFLLPSVADVAPQGKAKDSTIPAKHLDDLTNGDSSTPLSSVEHAEMMRRQRPDSSVKGDVPEGFVPTSAMNGRSAGTGMKTDAPMVKRI